MSRGVTDVVGHNQIPGRFRGRIDLSQQWIRVRAGDWNQDLLAL